jgi:hypothetical protein
LFIDAARGAVPFDLSIFVEERLYLVSSESCLVEPDSNEVIVNSKNMFRWVSVIATLALACFILAANAEASTLSGNLTADNAFFVYISTNDSVLGTLVSQGNNWPSTFSFSDALTSGVTNYLHIEAINYGGPGAFIGQFTLSDAGFSFANGTQTLLTNATNWTGVYNDSNSNVVAQNWIQPTGGVTSLGANGIGPWGTISNVSSNADWIWASDANSLPGGSTCQFCTIDLSTKIYATPEPSSLALMAAGFGLLLACGAKRQRSQSRQPAV